MTRQYFDFWENRPKKERILAHSARLKMTAYIGLIVLGHFVVAGGAKASGSDQPRFNNLEGKTTVALVRKSSQEGGLRKKLKAKKIEEQHIEEQNLYANPSRGLLNLDDPATRSELNSLFSAGQKAKTSNASENPALGTDSESQNPALGQPQIAEQEPPESPASQNPALGGPQVTQEPDSPSNMSYLSPTGTGIRRTTGFPTEDGILYIGFSRLREKDETSEAFAARLAGPEFNNSRGGPVSSGGHSLTPSGNYYAEGTPSSRRIAPSASPATKNGTD